MSKILRNKKTNRNEEEPVIEQKIMLWITLHLIYLGGNKHEASVNIIYSMSKKVISVCTNIQRYLCFIFFLLTFLSVLECFFELLMVVKYTTHLNRNSYKM